MLILKHYFATTNAIKLFTKRYLDTGTATDKSTLSYKFSNLVHVIVSTGMYPCT